jgi:hypothetical protein
MIKAGYPVVVVTAKGIYDKNNFLYSNCFRTYNQEQLLVADNQTRRYQEASLEERAMLTKLAWGY